MLACVPCLSSVYAIVNPLFWHTGQEKPFFQRLIAGYYHLWFLYMILGLYILAPILRAITASKSITQYFLLLFVIVTLILPTLKQTPLGDTLQYPLEKINLSLLGGFAGYWILGFWIEKYFIGSQTTKTIIHLIAIAALVFTIWITNHLSVRQGRADSYWYEYLRVNVALMACGVFVLFKDKIATIHFSQRAQKIIVFLSQNAFGVYLVHPFFLDCCRYNGLSPLSFNPALSIPVLSIAIFAISLFVSWLLRLIPVLRKYVL